MGVRRPGEPRSRAGIGRRMVILPVGSVGFVDFGMARPMSFPANDTASEGGEEVLVVTTYLIPDSWRPAHPYTEARLRGAQMPIGLKAHYPIVEVV